MKTSNYKALTVNSEKGVALIIALGILAILAILGTSFAINMRLEQKASANYRDSVKAKYIAWMGIEEAIALLNPTIDTNAWDSLDENWYDDFLETVAGTGTNIESNLSITSRWIDVTTTVGTDTILVGRYAVLVLDETGKININAAGCAQNEGWSTYEISMDVLDDIYSYWITTNKDSTVEVIDYRYGSDGIPGVTTNKVDGIDNNADNDIDVNNDWDPYEFGQGADDRPFLTAESIKLVSDIGPATWTGVKNHITVYSVDENISSNGNYRININTSNVTNLVNALTNGGMALNTAEQVAVNLIDYRDTDGEPTFDSGSGKYGLEKTVYINEVEAAPVPTGNPVTPTEGAIRDYGEYIELFNPYDATNVVYIIGGGLTVDDKFTVPPRSYYVIGDTVGEQWTLLLGWQPYTGSKKPADADTEKALTLSDVGENLTLRASAGTIEVVNYGSAGDTGNTGKENTRQKHDPRVGTWWTETETWKTNSVNWLSAAGDGVDADGWQTHFRIKNDNFASIGEVGYIHTGEQWKTVRFWTSAASTNHNGNVCDYITIAANPTNAVSGRININTASEAILTGLPNVDTNLAQNIIDGRPFTTIGEVVEIAGMADADGDGSDEDDDEGKEAIFRSLSNLITVRSDIFEVICLAQAIKSSDGVFDANDQILAEKKIRAVVDRRSPIQILYWREE